MTLVEQCGQDVRCVQDAKAPTLSRKIRELRDAMRLEEQLTKDQIYLNTAYYGDGAYGVQVAARHYFSTTAAQLTPPQAALLAGPVQNRDSLNPVAEPVAAVSRRKVVLDLMLQLNLITSAAATSAEKTRFRRAGVHKLMRNGCLGTRYPFLCDYVRRSLLRSSSLGMTVDQRRQLLNRGGLIIQTAIDPHTQDRPAQGQRGRRPDRSVDLHDEHDPARGRTDRGHVATRSAD